MHQRRSSIDIIRMVVESLTFPVDIVSIVTTGNTHVLTVCNLYHAQPGFTVTIGGNEYTITEIDAQYADSCSDGGPVYTMTVEGSVNISVDNFTLYAPKFFHGTPIQTDAEITEIPNAADKTPMIWALENYKDHFYDDPENARDRDLRMRIFFLTQPGLATEKTDDRYHHCIEPMRRLQERFVDRLRAMRGDFNTHDWEYEVENYARFGVYINNKGVEKNWFADKLSGCELNLNPLIVLKDGICSLECP